MFDKKDSDDSHESVSVNSVFDEFSFDIKFIVGPILN